MSRPLAIIAAAGLLFIAGCEKKPSDTVPVVAPEPATSPADVLKHLKYAMVRKDPKHLEAFVPDNRDKFLGAVSWFYSRAGVLGIRLTEEEIETIGVQDLVQKGYISTRWSRGEFDKELKILDSGKAIDDETMKSLSTVNQARLDMPRQVIPDKKLADKLLKDLTETIDANPKAIYAAGLYRMLKAIPTYGWQNIEAIVSNHKGGDKKLNDVRLMINETTEITYVTVGHNPDGTMFIWFLDFDKYPAAIARLFPEPVADGK
ncbi:MAG: hypothetical protein LBC63_00355 [Holophagales bacterium]|jgi:hypothetical protein|nr:hypothetical protein [Holophagales bacterium]